MVTKESRRERRTHVLSNAEGGTRRNSERKPASEEHSLSVKRRAGGNSRYRKRARDRRVYTTISQIVRNR
jgi:hypothetical protein